MATVLDLGDGRFIAGDPVDELPAGYDWCGSCAGSGLDSGYDFDGAIDLCWRCSGDGVDPFRRHPLIPVRRTAP